MYLIMLVVSMLLPMRVSAQTVKGKLVDESNHPLPYANVVLLSLPDSAFVSGTISGEDGLFKLEATSVKQIVKISSIGYKTVYKPTTPANMGIVQLVSDARMLGEVVVKANLPVTRIKNDALETPFVASRASLAILTATFSTFALKVERAEAGLLFRILCTVPCEHPTSFAICFSYP